MGRKAISEQQLAISNQQFAINKNIITDEHIMDQKAISRKICISEPLDNRT
jgi:hypothetical protein